MPAASVTWKTAFSGEPEAVTKVHARRFAALGEDLAARGVDVEATLRDLAAFEVAIPSWGMGVGGTRFGRFPLPGMPRTFDDKMDDIAVLQTLTRSAGSVSLHIPWDEPADPKAMVAGIAARGLRIGSVNSNTFQDQPGQAHSYRYGSLTHVDAAVRKQAIEHNLHVIEVGKALGAASITVWVADGSNYPGQVHLRHEFERYIAGCQKIHAALPDGWRMYLEHKPYEPATHHSVNYDWGSSYAAALQVGERCLCLVDFGHHLHGTAIELVVARLVGLGRLGGFHFNDSRYADDDNTAGSVHPYELFLVFAELVEAARDPAVRDLAPEHMIDQSEFIKDPLESLLQTVDALQAAHAQALIVDHAALAAARAGNDVMAAERCLQTAFRTDVGPLVAEMRRRKGGAIDPIDAFRASGYRAAMAKVRAADIAHATTI